MHDLQLSFYCPLCCTTSAILAGAHSYFVISSFKCEGKILQLFLEYVFHHKKVLRSYLLNVVKVSAMYVCEFVMPTLIAIQAFGPRHTANLFLISAPLWRATLQDDA